MKIKSILASVAACAVAVSAMALTAGAAITNDNNGGSGYMITLNETEGLAWNGGISGAVVDVTLASGWTETGAGGGVIFQGAGVEWSDGSKEWGISGEGTDAKNVEGVTVAVSGDNLTITYDFGGAIFAADADWGQCVVQTWWGADITVNDIKFLDLSGNVIGATTGDDSSAPADDSSASDASSTPAGDSSAADASSTPAATGSQTGDAGVAVAVAALALAGTAAVVARKKH